MHRRVAISLLIAALVGCALAEDHWVWASRNRQQRAFDDERSNERLREALYAHSEREPTTKRPGTGSPQNDGIDDYLDTENTKVGTRNYPYAQPSGAGFSGNQVFGLNGYPGATGFNGGIGSDVRAANGILIGPGGPTGIIGRPQHGIPGPGGLSGFPGGFGGGYAGQSGLGGAGQAYPGTFSGEGQLTPGGYLRPDAGQNTGFVQHPGGHYPGGQYPGGQYAGGRYPGGQYEGGQFAGAQFTGGQYAGGQYSGGQYSGGQFAGGQYPSSQFAGGQYPGGQYPAQFSGGGPQYTEGYGLAYTGNAGYPGNPYGGSSGYAIGFDETKRKLHPQGKSVSIESRNSAAQKVDDKVSLKTSKKA